MRTSKMRSLIYVAGPMTAPDGWVWNQNCLRAMEVGFELIALGASVHVPQAMGLMFKDTYDHSTWMEVDLAVLKRCDGMVTVSGWENSKGVNIELDFARDNDISILSLPPLPWNKPVREQIRNWIIDLDGGQ